MFCQFLLVRVWVSQAPQALSLGNLVVAKIKGQRVEELNLQRLTLELWHEHDEVVLQASYALLRFTSC